MIDGRLARSLSSRHPKPRAARPERSVDTIPPATAITAESPAETREGLKRIASALRRQKIALGLMVATLRQNVIEKEGFDLAREYADGAECVRNDLLSDAIETLEALASLDEATLRRRFEERCEIHVEL